MNTVIAPSEILLLKVLILGFFFGWTSKRFSRAKFYEISNYKFMSMDDRPAKVKL